MELLIGIALIYGLFKLVSSAFRGKKTSATKPETTTRPTASRRPPPPKTPTVTITVGSGSDEQSNISAKANSENCWVEAGRTVMVAGYSIPDGMMYVGKGLASVSGVRIEPALIDPSLSVDRSNPDRSGSDMGYWPSYNSINSGCRAAY